MLPAAEIKLVVLLTRQLPITSNEQSGRGLETTHITPDRPIPQRVTEQERLSKPYLVERYAFCTLEKKARFPSNEYPIIGREIINWQASQQVVHYRQVTGLPVDGHKQELPVCTLKQ
jgi:hypothetical protein